MLRCVQVKETYCLSSNQTCFRNITATNGLLQTKPVYSTCTQQKHMLRCVQVKETYCLSSNQTFIRVIRITSLKTPPLVAVMEEIRQARPMHDIPDTQNTMGISIRGKRIPWVYLLEEREYHEYIYQRKEVCSLVPTVGFRDQTVGHRVIGWALTPFTTKDQGRELMYMKCSFRGCKLKRFWFMELPETDQDYFWNSRKTSAGKNYSPKCLVVYYPRFTGETPGNFKSFSDCQGCADKELSSSVSNVWNMWLIGSVGMNITTR